MARRYRKKRSHGKAKPSIVALVPAVALGAMAYNGYSKDGAKGALGSIVNATTGYSVYAGKFMPSVETYGFYGSIVGAFVGKKLIAMTGVNRAMKGLPFRL